MNIESMLPSLLNLIKKVYDFVNEFGTKVQKKKFFEECTKLKTKIQKADRDATEKEKEALNDRIPPE